MNKEVTVILTSCGRFDLLRRTIESFLLHNTYPIKEWWIYEDSGKGAPEWRNDFPFITWVCSLERYGQIHALDALWKLVGTRYAFCLEDDWEFCKGGFIEASMDIMELNKEVMQVWLQPLEEHNVHPIEWVTQNISVGKIAHFGMMAPLFSAIRFNPSLKRKSDYDLIAPFSKHTTWNAEKPWKCEADIAKVYTSMGFRAAILPTRYVTHIGTNQHVGP